MWFVNSSNVIG